MTDLSHSHATELPRENPAEVRAHRETFHAFSKLTLFGVLHVVLVLVSMALGFFGNAPVLAVMLGVGGTLALIVAFLVMD